MRPDPWKGAVWGGALAVLLSLAVFGASLLDEAGRLAGALLGVGVGAALGCVIALVVGVVVVIVRLAPPRVAFLVFVGWLTSAAALLLGAMLLAPLVAAGAIAAFGLAGAGVAALVGARSVPGARRAPALIALILGVGGIGTLVAWLAGAGATGEPRPMTPDGRSRVLANGDLSDPSLRGPFAVRRLTYGSGTDLRRPEFGSRVDLRTDPVDGTPFLETWTGLRAMLRKRYWGFDRDRLPVNGRVWLPEGDGPFPLVLIVHGNHLMHEFSDTGYTYLAELLASRGFIAVSVDQNFLNVSLLRIFGSWGETDARAWLLLEHLRLWRAWNASPDSPFHAKVAMDRIALIGHSRGGAAASIAVSFNRLGRFPDDARVVFDYGFGIRSVVAIAPADGQYRPARRDNPLEGVSYLVLHGSHDSDVFTFMGLRQYHRARLEEGGIKSAIYIHRANHGQFNSVWGAGDLAGLFRYFQNLEALLSGEEQRQIAKVVIVAFLEATLNDRREFLHVLRDPRIARRWLPDALLLSRFATSEDRVVSSFEEDPDPTSTTVPEGRGGGGELAVWREQEIESRWGTFQNSGVFLGWRAGESAPARYRIELPPGLARSWEVDDSTVLFFSLADADEALPEGEEPPGRDVDLSVVVLDTRGEEAKLPLSHCSVLPRAIEAAGRRSRAMHSRKRSEVVFLTFEFPLADFARANPAFDAGSIVAVELVFDRTPEGVIVLDDLGFRPGP